MRTILFAAFGMGAMLTTGAIIPAMAQVRGYSAVSPNGQTPIDVDVNVSVVSSDRYRGEHYQDAYYEDRYYREQAYRDRYYEDAYYRDRSRSYRKGEVFYPRQDNSGDVITGVLVGAIIGYAIAESNDRHHYRRSSYRHYRYYDRGYHHREKRRKYYGYGY